MMLPIQSHQRIELIDITAEVQRVLKELPRVSSGICHVFIRHTTAGITINESADPDVCRDLIDWLNGVAPHQAGYRHREGNSDAHIKSSLVGVSASIPIENNRLQLGTWQGIFFCEFDGPRKRSVHIDVLSSPLPVDVHP